MALTISAAASANSTTSSATLSISSSLVSWSNPDVIVVVVAADNNGTNGAASISSVTDSKGHAYTQRRVSNQDPGAAAAGATVAIYTAVATTGFVNGDTITVNFSPNTAAKAMYVWKVAAASTEFVKYVNAGGAVGATANPTVTTVSVTSGDAVIGGLAGETNVNPTADSDTTNGSWVGAVNVVGNTGTVATSMHLHTQYKITTGTGTQTWNQTRVAGDWASAYIILDAAARIDRTATGSGAGTDTDAHVVTRLRTATGSGAGTQSASGVIITIVDRTATGSGVGTATASKVRTAVRAATGSGTGTAGTVTLHNNVRSATGSGGASTGDNATPLVARRRTATGSGTGSSTSSENIILGTPTHQRTATGGGTGSESAIRLRSVLRSGSASGSSGFDSTGVVIRARSGTGSGTGSATEVHLRSSLRSGTGTGVGSYAVVSGKASLRAATGTGEGWSYTRGDRVVVLLLKPRKNVTVSKVYPPPRKPTGYQPLFPPRGRWN